MNAGGRITEGNKVTNDGVLHRLQNDCYENHNHGTHTQDTHVEYHQPIHAVADDTSDTSGDERDDDNDVPILCRGSSRKKKLPVNYKGMFTTK